MNNTNVELVEDEWSERIRQDLKNSLAVIVPFPARMIKPEGQAAAPDDFELAFSPNYDKYRNDFAHDIAQLVADCFQFVPGAKSSALEPRPYQVGPAAQSWPIWLLTLYLDARPLLNDASTLWAIGSAAKSVVSKIGPVFHKHKLQVDVDMLPVIFSEPVLLAICFAHVRETYHPRATIRMDSFVRSENPDYASVDHPGGWERYTVSATVGRKCYIYEIDSRARISNHYLLEGTQVKPLTIPNLRGVYYFPIEEGSKVRSVFVGSSLSE